MACLVMYLFQNSWEAFWAESSNKVWLQDYFRHYFKEKVECLEDIIMSGIMYGEDVLNADSLPAIKILPDGYEVEIEWLNVRLK